MRLLIKLLIFIFLIFQIKAAAEGLLKVTHLNVDQGDAAIIEFPSGVVMEIDSGKGGGFAGSESMGRKSIIPYLKNNKIIKIDIAVSTHPDFDHIGGYQEVLREMSVSEYWESAGHTTNTYKNLLSIIKIKNIDYYLGYKMIKLRLDELNKTNFFGKNVKVVILGPLFKYKNNNDASLCFMIKYNKKTFMLCGDAGFDPQENMADKYEKSLKSDFLLVPHHGSSHNYNRKFLNFVKPEIAIISAGYQNKFKHPKNEIVNAYYSAGVKLFRTDILQSHIQIATDGIDYKINLIDNELKEIDLSLSRISLENGK